MSYEWREYDFIPDGAWHGEVIDDNGFVIAEVWHNGDSSGNFYLWHDAIHRREIEGMASEVGMDAWLGELKQAWLDNTTQNDLEL